MEPFVGNASENQLKSADLKDNEKRIYTQHVNIDVDIDMQNRSIRN